MKIVVLGTRGIPAIPGGIETHCEELYPRLVARYACEVTVITRTPYVKEKKSFFKGVKLFNLWSPRYKNFETIIHSIIGLGMARLLSPDILHIHAIGPALVTPLARLLGLKVVVTHHGPDYDRQKWGFIAKAMLRLGERLGCRFANRIIVISETIKILVKQRHERSDAVLIPNGVNTPPPLTSTDYLETMGLEQKKYIVAVGRFVEEKGLHDLIAAYAGLQDKPIPLVIVGDANHETIYSRELKEAALKNGVVMTGYLKGEKLVQIFSMARLFVTPSYHEGLSITLLEALSYGLDVLVSNIPANREVGLDENNYFAAGDVVGLRLALQKKIEHKKLPDYSKILEKYNWDRISSQTWNLYQEVVGHHN